MQEKIKCPTCKNLIYPEDQFCDSCLENAPEKPDGLQSASFDSWLYRNLAPRPIEEAGMLPSDFDYPIFVVPLSYVERYNNEEDKDQNGITPICAYYWKILENTQRHNLDALEIPEYVKYINNDYISESLMQFCFNA